MKNLISTFFLLSILLLAFTNNVYAQDAKIGSEMVFVIKPTDLRNEDRNLYAKEFNASLRNVLENYWDLDIKYQFMIEKNAYKYARKGKNVLYGEFVSEMEIGRINTETTFVVRRGVKKILEVRLPSSLNKVDLVYAIMHSQFMLRNLATFKKPSKDLPKKYGHILKKKTLLIASEHLSKKLSESDIKGVYPHKFKVLPYKEIEAAILNKDEEFIVLYEASMPGNVTEGNYSFWNIYQPNDGVVITRHGGSKGLSKADLGVFVKRTK